MLLDPGQDFVCGDPEFCVQQVDRDTDCLFVSAVVENLAQVFQRAASLGGVESLCSLPILTSQYGLTDEELKAAGVTRGMMRLSVGLEDPQDLIADLQQALS